MRLKARAAVVAAVVAVAMGVGGSAVAQLDLPGMDGADEATGGFVGPAANELGATEHGDCVKDLLDLPALNACEDEEGRVIMDLPGLKLVGPAADKSEPEDSLPNTGVNVGDVAAIGLATLGLGGVFLRRLRFSAAA